MKLSTCHFCKNIFTKTMSRNVCTPCLLKEEDHFVIVKKYLREHPDTRIIDLSKATEVPIESIEFFLESGRLVGSAASALKVECKTCGKEIKGQVVCNECSEELKNGLAQATRDLQGRAKRDPLNNRSDLFKGEHKL